MKYFQREVESLSKAHHVPYDGWIWGHTLVDFKSIATRCLQSKHTSLNLIQRVGLTSFRPNITEMSLWERFKHNQDEQYV